MRITNQFRRLAACAGLGWAAADLIPPHSHFTKADWVISVTAVGIYVMSLFIKEDSPDV